MPNFCLSHKRVKVLARMRISASRPGKNRQRAFAAAAPRSGPRTAGFRNEIRIRAGTRESGMLPCGPGGCGAYRSFLMKLFTGSLAAGLVLLAGGAQAQVPGPYENGRPRYTAASDFGAPDAVAPQPVPGPQYVPGPRYGYGPSLLPSTEVYSVLRDNGFSPLGIPRLRGFVYTIAVIDRGGADGRLIIDARNGRIIRFLPAYRTATISTRSRALSAGPSWLSRRRPKQRHRPKRRTRSRPRRARHGPPMLRAARCRCRRPARSPPSLRRRRSSRRPRLPRSRPRCRRPLR